MFRVIILGYQRQLSSQLLFSVSILFQLFLMLYDRRHETSYDIRPRIVESRSAAHHGELPFQRDLPSASVPSIHQEVGCVPQRGRVRVPTDHFCSILRVSTVYQSPCLSFGSHHVHVLIGIATFNGRHRWGCFRRLIRVHNFYVVAFPFACVFTLAFTSMSVIDLFSVIDGRNHVPGKNSVPVSARRYISCSFSHCISWESMLRAGSSIVSSFSVGEGPSEFLEKSLSVVWLTRDVMLVLLFAVSSATVSFCEAMCSAFWYFVNVGISILLSPPDRSFHWCLGALVSLVLGEICRCATTDSSATLSVCWICGISMCWFTWLSISLMDLWCSFTLAPGRRPRTCSPNGRVSFLYFCPRIFSNGVIRVSILEVCMSPEVSLVSTAVSINIVSLPSNDGGLPRTSWRWHLFLQTWLKTRGLLGPCEVCAYRGQTLYCTTELSLSVDKMEEENKERTTLVCNVYECRVCHVLKTRNTYISANNLSGLVVVCFLVSLRPDHVCPFGGLSLNIVNLLKPVHVSDNSRPPSTFQ